MSKFICIDSTRDVGRTILLNLNWVARIELTQEDPSSEKNGVHVKCLSDDAFALATLYFDSMEAAHQWVSEQLDIRL